MEVMGDLAHAHDLDREEARLAAWGHDLAREMARSDLLAEAQRLAIRVGDEETLEPLLLHGPIAAAWLQAEGQGTPSVWQAISHHTTAGPHLDRLGKALFIADGVEPGRRFEGRAELLELSLKDLDKGYCHVLRQTQDYLTSRGLAIHPLMRQAWLECLDIQH